MRKGYIPFIVVLVARAGGVCVHQCVVVAHSGRQVEPVLGFGVLGG